MKFNSLVWVVFIAIYAQTYQLRAQSNDMLMVSAKLDSQKATIKEIIHGIQILENVQLSYSERNLSGLDQEIDIPEGTQTVQSLLDLIAEKGDLSYQLVGKNIILKQAQLGKQKRQQLYNVSGYVYDEQNGETMIGTTIQIKGTYDGTVTNVYGFYSLSVPAGGLTLVYSSIGYGQVEKFIQVSDHLRLDVNMKSASKVLSEVVIVGDQPEDHILENQMGYASISAQEISGIPALLGEVDILRTLKLLPGVQMTSETSSGFSVRGGGHDQNLILLDEAVVYNPSHLLGFFSTFNNDAVKNMEFYKGNMPARYGGRLSSMLDIRMKEGNNRRFTGQGGISPIASRLTLEVPIVKNKGSIMLAGRRTYADALARAIRPSLAKNATLYFYDFNLKANYSINQNNRIYLSSYMGKDVLRIKSGGNGEPDFRWGNITNTLRWNHIFSEKLFANTSLIFSNYDYRLGLGFEDFSFLWKSNLRDYTAKVDFDFFLNPENTLVFGFSSTLHKFDPGLVELKTGEEEGKGRIPRNQALDHAVYLGNEQKISEKWSLSYGGRLGIFQNIGKATLFKYNDDYERVDSTGFKKGEIYHTYFSFEPRLAATYVLNPNRSLKASYARTTQFLHLASNSISGTPLDIWIPSSPNVRPQLADQVSVGIFENLFNNQIQASVEVYYKWMHRQIDFRDHAELLLNDEIENELRVGKSWAYGAEFLLKKPAGKINGWVSFTWSRSFRKIPEINDGLTYNSTFDRPFNVSTAINYEFLPRFTLSATWTYFNGLPFTAPTGRMHYGNIVLPTYSGRNGDRLPSYHRLDAGINFDVKQRPGQKVKSSWNISVYNAYGRKNAALINFRTKEDDSLETEAIRTTVFRWVPTITWNFKF